MAPSRSRLLALVSVAIACSSSTSLSASLPNALWMRLRTAALKADLSAGFAGVPSLRGRPRGLPVVPGGNLGIFSFCQATGTHSPSTKTPGMNTKDFMVVVCDIQTLVKVGSGLLSGCAAADANDGFLPKNPIPWDS